VSSVESQAEESVAHAADALFAAQRPDGSWPNRRPAAVLGTAGAITALHLADRERSQDMIQRGTRWLVNARNEEGGWGGVAGAATQLVPSIVAAAALQLVNPDKAKEPIRRALEVVRSHGGMAALSDPGMVNMATTFLALAGQADLQGVRRIPLELLLLPQRLWRTRLSFRMAPFVALAFIHTRYGPQHNAPRLRDRLARRAGLRLLAQMERAENDRGGYGGDNWLASVVCIGLHCTEDGDDATRAAVSAAVHYLRSNVHDDGSWHIMQGLDLIGSSFVTAGLADAGYAADARLERARTWLLSCQQDDGFPLYGAPPGGWGWEGPHGWPNLLDSATALRALSAGESHTQVRRGLRWLASRQDRAGSWGTFVTDTTLPNDGPCPYVTAQCVEVLLDAGFPRHDRRIVRALDWLIARQRNDGTYDALWYRGRTPGTAMVLTAFARAGLIDHPATRRAREALQRAQLPNGSWGPGLTGTLGDDPSAGTVEETAWAVRALLTAGVPAHDEGVRHGVCWLLSSQQPDGRWPASQICMHIRDLAYYVDGLIVDGLALAALGRYRASLDAARSTPAREAS